MNDNARSDVAERCRVVRAVYLDVRVNVYATLDDSIVLETRRRQGQERRALLIKHLSYLSLCRSVNAGERPSFVPALQEYVLLLDAFKRTSFQSRSLRMPNRRLDFPLQVGCVRATGNCNNAIMCKHR